MGISTLPKVVRGIAVILISIAVYYMLVAVLRMVVDVNVTILGLSVAYAAAISMSVLICTMLVYAYVPRTIYEQTQPRTPDLRQTRPQTQQMGNYDRIARSTLRQPEPEPQVGMAPGPEPAQEPTPQPPTLTPKSATPQDLQDKLDHLQNVMKRAFAELQIELCELREKAKEVE